MLAVGDLDDVPHIVQRGEEALCVPQSEAVVIIIIIIIIIVVIIIIIIIIVVIIIIIVIIIFIIIVIIIRNRLCVCRSLKPDMNMII